MFLTFRKSPIKEYQIPAAVDCYERTREACEKMHREQGYCIDADGKTVTVDNLYHAPRRLNGKIIIGVVQLCKRERLNTMHDYRDRKIDIDEFVRRLEIAKMTEQAARNHRKKGK